MNQPASIFRFLNFKVYQDSKVFYRNIVITTSKFPNTYKHLAEQLRRSSLSVVLNIAEGSAKKSDKDFNRYIKNSLGSINESVASIDVAHQEKLIAQGYFDKLISDATEIAKQLGGFSKKLK